ncbi:MAG: three-Cys-motif partner protein TcmP [Verrucomicrobia bacterium]|nr:three-Cys-motif partner protein TcmP [Verrucomicrobiota bacterium]
MAAGDFHARPFDEGTLTKLQIFELYAREWLPVFLASVPPLRAEVHLFDFFAGPGMDASGQLGSPLRLLTQLKAYQNLSGWAHVRIHAHFFDASKGKIKELVTNIDDHNLRLPAVNLDVRPLEFHDALQDCAPLLASTCAAKLVFIDQCGVDQVTPEVFLQLVKSPTCDFLFFISSSTLHRFRDHPAIKQKITRPEDSYHVHRAVLNFYRGHLPRGSAYYLAPFSIRKGANVYGLIFGSAHPKGMDKFLQVAWKTDETNGEANYDINRENIQRGEMLLDLPELHPTKLTAFERELEDSLRAGRFANELDVVRICFSHGVKREHAKPVLAKLKREKVIDTDFSVPQIKLSEKPRPIRMLL